MSATDIDNNVWIVTDSNSGISFKEAQSLDIGLVSMPFFIDGSEYLEGINMSRQRFFQLLREGCSVSTSQPPVARLAKLFEDGLASHTSIVYIPMSSALSSSCMTALCLASSFDGRVQVVDNKRISCTQKQSVLEAVYLKNKGYSAKDIKEILEKHKNDASIYIAVEDISYLKKGGRMSTREAICSTCLDIRPVLEINGGLLEFYTKARGVKAAQKKILDAIDHDMSHRFFGKDVLIKGAYSGGEDVKKAWYKVLSERYPAHIISLDHLPLSICCHIGEGAVAAVCMEKLEEAPFIRYEI